MPHVHTAPNQHDMTVSAYIILRDGGELKCLVHLHKKAGKLMQIGGHIELDETPWKTMVHELFEESGYKTTELKILQFRREVAESGDNIVHPVPFTMNTHNVGDDHYHSDLCYGFVASSLPGALVGEGESNDLQWLTLNELKEGLSRGEVLSDVVGIYEYLLSGLDGMVEVPASQFSQDKPTRAIMTYQVGSAGDQRTLGNDERKQFDHNLKTGE